MMTAYIVFTKVHTKDQAALDHYASMTHVADGHPLTPLVVYGRQEILEGPQHEAMAILSFPSMSAARAWYDSAAYQEAREHRLRGAVYQVTLIEGVD